MTARSNQGRAPVISAVLLALVPLLSQAQATYSTTRGSGFGYRADGVLNTEVVEPGQPQLCVNTSYSFDAYGNKTGASTQNCAGAAGLALFDTRSSSSSYASFSVTITGFGSATVPAGTFATSATNALAHSESRTYDPRFGAVLSLTGPNNLTTSWQVDDFGRKVHELRPDGNRTRIYYCYLAKTFPNGYTTSTASNTSGCPSPAAAEIPADAVMFEHSETVDYNQTVYIGPSSRVYYDRAGRKIRTVSESFDGPSQSNTNVIVQDTDYTAQGVARVVTQPYFLNGGAGTAAPAGEYGMKLTEVDALGRPTAVYTTDPATSGAGVGSQSGGSQASVTFGSRGTRRASVTFFAYSGLVTVTTDDQGHTRKEEKNSEGRLVRVTDGIGATADAGAQIVHQHDAMGNLIKTKDALQNVVTIDYDVRGRKTLLSDPDAGVVAYCYDALGQLKAQQNSKMRGSHTPAACPGVSGTGTTAPSVAGWTTMAYDLLGRMTSRVEPEYSSSWAYDSCSTGKGKLCASATSTGLSRTSTYDTLGRPLNSRTDFGDGTSMASALSYDGYGRVETMTYPTGVRLRYQYSGRGFLMYVKLDTQVTVNPLPSTPGGTPVAGTTLGVGTVLWDGQRYNAAGKLELQAYSNGVNSRAVYDNLSSRLLALTAGAGSTNTVVNQRYSWDGISQLTARVDAIGDGTGVEVSDSLSYDRIGRLTSYTVVGGTSGSAASRSVTLQYNALGMLTYKSDVGTYTYGGSQPHALQGVSGAVSVGYSYDLNGNAITASSGNYRTIGYTSFNLPDSNTGIAGPGNSPRYTWWYDENHQRIKEVRVNGNGTRTTWSLHPDNQGGLGFEREVATNGVQSNRHYISAGGATIAVLVTSGALPTLTAGQTAPPAIASATAVKLEFWHKDHLGSLIATTDHAGNVTERYSYDPFGKRRYLNSSYDPFGSLVYDWTTDTNRGTDRGYTGHEQLDDIGLVHMNGRVYDATIARFLQADPFIQDPTNLQNFDRYAYCFNNPLTCTDPSGYFSLKSFLRSVAAIAIAVFAPEFIGSLMTSGGAGAFAVATVDAAGFSYMSLTTLGSVTSSAIAGFASGAIASGSLKGGLQGAFSAALFFGAGDMISGTGAFAGTGGVADTFGQVAIHGVAGCISSVAGGGKCGPGALSAAFSKASLSMTSGLKDGLERGFAHAIIGGTASVLGGGKFANGAQSGAFSYLFNQLAHGDASGDAGSPESNPARGMSNTAGDTAGLYALGGLTVGATGAAVFGPSIAAGLYELGGGMSLVRFVGAQGEAAVGWIGEKYAITSAAGRTFIADGVTFASVNEVKNVAALSLTPQIRAFGDFAVQSGRQFNLWVRSETTFSAPLSRYLQSIGAQVKTIPGK